MNVGFDLDETLALNTIKRNRYNMYEVYRTCKPQHLETAYNVNGNIIYLVTGRKERFRKVTTEWLHDNNFQYDKIYFFNGDKKTTENLAKHKIDVIKRKGIKIFFEDTPAIASLIKTEVPECTVFLLVNKHLLRLDYLG